MNFEQALNAMLKGKIVRRKAYKPETAIGIDAATKEIRLWHNDLLNGSHFGVIVSLGDDMLADDWTVVNDLDCLKSVLEYHDNQVDLLKEKELKEKELQSIIAELREKCEYWQGEYETSQQRINSAEEASRKLNDTLEHKNTQTGELREEVMYLKGKIAAYETMLKGE